MTTLTVTDAVSQHVNDLRGWARANLAGRVITVASPKGGVGKTTIAQEVAYALDAVAVDLDWNDGNLARAMGWFHEQRVRSPLLDALDTGKTPRPIVGRSRPDLIAAGPEFGANQPSMTAMQDALRRWAGELDRLLVVDCHPGDGDAAYGAIAAADSVLTPTLLGQREMDALSGWCEKFDGYPLFVVPNQIPPVPPGRLLDRLTEIVEARGLGVSTPVPRESWLPRRAARTTLLSSRASKRSLKIQTALAAVAKETGTRVA